MKKVFKTFLVISVILFIISGLWFYIEHSLPNDETVKKEFLAKNPNSEVVNIELIFDHAPKNVLTYLVKFKEPEKNEILMDDFAIKRHSIFQWHWCSDQTERKCD